MSDLYCPGDPGAPCGLPIEIIDMQECRSTDPGGKTCIADMWCVAGHHYIGCPEDILGL